MIPELDLVEEEDKITHTITLEDECDGQDGCNLFQFDPNYEQTEAEWDEIKKKDYFKQKYDIKPKIIE